MITTRPHLFIMGLSHCQIKRISAKKKPEPAIYKLDRLLKNFWLRLYNANMKAVSAYSLIFVVLCSSGMAAIAPHHYEYKYCKMAPVLSCKYTIDPFKAWNGSFESSPTVLRRCDWCSHLSWRLQYDSWDTYKGLTHSVLLVNWCSNRHWRSSVLQRQSSVLSNKAVLQIYGGAGMPQIYQLCNAQMRAF